MTQFQSPYADPMTPGLAADRPTSGLAITALILAIIPCTSIIGALLGIIGVITLNSTSLKKGRGLSIAAVLIGTLITAIAVGAIWWGASVFRGWIQVVMQGPAPALQAGFDGNVAGFKDGFIGAGAAATDMEAQAFLDELESRYGAYQSCMFDEQRGGQQRQQSNKPAVPFPYKLEFANQKTINATAEVVFYDEKTGAWPNKINYIVIEDPDLGDLIYPASFKLMNGSVVPADSSSHDPADADSSADHDAGTNAEAPPGG